MKKTVVVAVVVMLVLEAWVRAEKHVGAFNLYMVTSFDFSQYPACSPGRSKYCIQAIRFYDPDSKRLLTEVPVDGVMPGRQRVVGTVRVHSIPRHAYTVTVYVDNTANLREGLPGDVSTFGVNAK